CSRGLAQCDSTVAPRCVRRRYVERAFADAGFQGIQARRLKRAAVVSAHHPAGIKAAFALWYSVIVSVVQNNVQTIHVFLEQYGMRNTTQKKTKMSPLWIINSWSHASDCVPNALSGPVG